MNQAELIEISAGAARYGIKLESGQVELLWRYLDILERWNAKMNLTGVERGDFVERHIWDSLVFLLAGINVRGRVADVGSGAGLPGIPLSIVVDNLQVTLIEARRKRCEFLEATVQELGLQDRVKVVLGRAEQLASARPLAKVESLRESFDCVVCRALASPTECLEYTLPLVRSGGGVIVSTGKKESGVFALPSKFARDLGAGEVTVKEFCLGGRLARVVYLVCIPKTNPTRAEFPRPTNKIRAADKQ